MGGLDLALNLSSRGDAGQPVTNQVTTMLGIARQSTYRDTTALFTCGNATQDDGVGRNGLP